MYDLTADKSRLVLQAGESSRLVLTISNTREQDSTCLVAVSRLDGPPAEEVAQKPKRKAKETDRPALDWQFNPQINLGPRQTGSVAFTVSCTTQADIGDYRFEILTADERNPDEQYSTLTVPLLVLPVPATKRRWWLWLLLGFFVILIVIILIIILTRPAFVPVPTVVGLNYTQAEARLAEVGLNAERTGTTHQELDRSVTMALKHARAEQAPRDVELTPWPDDALPPLKPDLVWRQSVDGAAERGGTVVLSVVPDIDSVPSITGQSLLDAMTHLADAGFRFDYRYAFPAQYRYGNDTSGVWHVQIPANDSWEVFWPVSDTPNEDAEESEGDPDTAEKSDSTPQAYRGSRLHLSSIPEQLTVPDFSSIAINQILTIKPFNLIFIFEQKRYDASQIADLRQVYRKVGKDLYAYRQNPAVGSQVARHPHTITVQLALGQAGATP